MASTSNTTKDHDQIRKWAEERNGKPSHVKSTGSEEDIGILRIDFPGFSGADSLEPISWDDWFAKFDERDLALVYQEETAGGEKSNFNKIISGVEIEAAPAKKKSPRKRPPTKSIAAKKSAPVAKKSVPPVKKSAAPAKKVTAKKAAVKKAAPKKAASKTPAAKKVSAKKVAVKKVVGKSAPVSKKAAPEKSSPKKAAPKRAAAKKSKSTRR